MEENIASRPHIRGVSQQGDGLIPERRERGESAKHTDEEEESGFTGEELMALSQASSHSDSEAPKEVHSHGPDRERSGRDGAQNEATDEVTEYRPDESSGPNEQHMGYPIRAQHSSVRTNLVQATCPRCPWSIANRALL